MVAERVDSNIRELEGALNRLALQAKLANSPLTVSLAADILDNLAPIRKVCSPVEIIRIVAAHFNLQASRSDRPPPHAGDCVGPSGGHVFDQ